MNMSDSIALLNNMFYLICSSNLCLIM